MCQPWGAGVYRLLEGCHALLESAWDELKGQCTYLPLAEGQSIGVHSRALACTASDIAVALARQSLFGLRLQLVRVHGDGGEDAVEHSRRINFILICTVRAGIVARVLNFAGVRHGLGAQTGRQRLWWLMQCSSNRSSRQKGSGTAEEVWRENHHAGRDAVWKRICALNPEV